MAGQWGVFWLGVALRGSLHVGHSGSDSEGRQGKEEELSENCDYNLIGC